jgi:NADPH:quinone reductase
VFGLGYPRAMAGLAAQVTSPPSLTTGTFAEYAVFEADTPGLAIRPAGLPPERAAALPTAGLTALPLLRAGGFRPGDVVLVTGATGGVGSMLVPMLAKAGAHVIATACAADDSYVRGLGANETVDYRAGDTAGQTLRRHPAGVDAVINLALRGDALASAARTIRPAGRLLNIVFPPTSVRRRISRLSRSMGLLEQICRQIAFGNAVKARMSGRAVSRWAATAGSLPSSASMTRSNWACTESLPGWS